ncbi:MAG: DUF4394 domain-containing protein [Bacteroidota bacterium]|nr:DUF4394 domain-containing protein [Bacteroidota bacterium]
MHKVFRAVLLVAAFLGSVFSIQAQTTLYALGTLTEDVAPGGSLYPPGALAGTQGIVGYNPSNATGIPNAPLVAITGVTGNQKLVDIDYRPLTGQLYALGYDPSLPVANAQLYRLDPKSGVATPVSAAPITLLLGGATERIGFNFNPLVDLIRVVSSNDMNYRLNPVTGDVAAPGTPDGPLAYAAGDTNFGLNPRVGGVAYTNPYAGATTTTLFDIDVKNDPSFPFGILSTQNPPNNGTLNTQADVKLLGQYGIDPAARVNFDIYWTGSFNKGYLVELTPRPNGYNATNLYRFSLPVIAGSPTDPGNTNPPGAATDKITIVPADPSTPFDVFSIAVAPMPVITSLVPPSATVGTPGLTLTINGTGFVNGTQVKFNGTNAAANRTTTYLSATQLTAVLTAADLATVGAYNVTVTNPPFPGVASAPAVFYVEPVCNAPTGLSAGSITSTSATISFTGNGSNSYTLTTSPATTTQTLPGTATSANLTGLMPGTSYTVTITGNCNSSTSGGPGTMSAPATVTFSTTAFSPQIAVSQGGTGIANGGTFSGFPSTQQGSTSAPVTFTISNSSTDALTLGAFTFSGPYALSGTAPTSVAAGGSATFNVTFSPTAAGTNTGSVSIANNSTGNNPYVVNFSGQGTSQDLVVSTAQAVQGSYRNVTIVGPNGVATLSGTLTVSGTLAVQAGGALVQNCQTINGAGNFDLQAGGTLAICDAAGIADSGPTGAVQVTGGRSYSPLANYIYNGTVAQVTGLGLPSSVLALGVQNSAGLTLSKTLRLTQGLNLNMGNLNTGGLTFTLVSKASGTAGVVNTGGVVVGTVTVQRYIDPSLNAGPGYRHFSSPVANSTVADLTTPKFTPVVNSNYNTVGSSATPFPTVFSYDETFVTTSGNPSPLDFDKGYRSPASLTDPLLVTRGYTVNIAANDTVDFVGTLNNGPLTASGLTRGTQATSGYHLRGNPYPAPLDWQLMINNGRLTGIDNALYVFKSSGQYAGSYAVYNNGVSTNGGTNILPLGQGFFVRTSTAGAPGSIAFTNAERLTAPNNTPFQRGTADSRTQLLLSLRNGTVATQAAIYFDRNATAGFDAAADAYAFSSPNGLALATEIPGSTETLAINGQPLPGTADVLLPLRLAAATAGTYTLAVDNLANLPAAYHAYLRDALTGTYTDLAATPSISLTLAANAAAGGRYAVLFTTQARVLATAPAALAQLASVYPNPAHASATLLLPVALRGKAATSVSVVDNLGRTVLTRTLAAGPAETLELPLAGLAPGVYSVLARTAAGLVAKRLVVQ